MDVAGKGGAAGGLAVRRVEAEMIEEQVGRLVEGQQVVGHIHVAVVVDPRRQHDAAVSVEWRVCHVLSFPCLRPRAR